MDVTQRRIRAGFTLVELLVVIVIIGILVSLVVVAAPLALDAAHRTRIKVELDNIAMAFQQYKNENGSYPPNFGLGPDADPAVDPRLDIVRHVKKAFPRNSDRLDDLLNLRPPLTPSEAVVLWLGGFSADPQRPFSGSNGPKFRIDDRNGTFEFDQSRIRESERSQNNPVMVDFNDGNGAVRVRLYEYYPPDLTEPYVYFDTSRYQPLPTNPPKRRNNWPTYPESPSNPVVRAYVEKPSAGPPQFVNSKSFQILSAGTDDDWGEPIGPENQLAFPDGPFTGGQADNLTNFTTGTLEDAQP